MTILYALISREKTVLAEHTATSATGNFPTVTRMLLSKIPSQDGKMTYVYDDYIFHYIVDCGVCYLSMSDETNKHRIPFAFLENVKSDFVSKYGLETISKSIAFAMNDDYKLVLEQKMNCYNNSDDPKNAMIIAGDNLGGLKSQIDDVKDVMVQNIERVLERGEKIELLVDKTDRLNQQAFQFENSSRQLRRALYWRKIKCYAVMGLITMLIIYAASVSICGFNYGHCKSSNDKNDNDNDTEDN